MANDIKIIWDKFRHFVIRDVEGKRRNEVTDFMLEKYFKPNRIFEQVKYFDDPSIYDVYRRYVKHILGGECSIVVEDSSTQELVGVALMNRMTESWHSWPALSLAVDESKLTEVIDLKYNMFNDYASEHWGSDLDTFHIFEYYIDEALHSDAEFMQRFFKVISEVARHMNSNRITFISLTGQEAVEAASAGFKQLTNVIYSIYLDKGTRPFGTLRDINEMQAVLFELQVPGLVPYYEMKVRGIDHSEIDVARDASSYHQFTSNDDDSYYSFY